MPVTVTVDVNATSIAQALRGDRGRQVVIADLQEIAVGQRAPDGESGPALTPTIVDPEAAAVGQIANHRLGLAVIGHQGGAAVTDGDRPDIDGRGVDRDGVASGSVDDGVVGGAGNAVRAPLGSR